ncbi:hypothetical protein PYW07_017470 [Mythimna separata]|uniref:Glucose-methanol-choline oxidoreductase N-terminal domain-containing protein n=1 Tax=Mythimna separata TaxID=271217 RepID=A0AAD7YY45_MYTSE|nr:hypothetical protein PYW07_017470 [Mythimna separata]
MDCSLGACAGAGPAGAAVAAALHFFAAAQCLLNEPYPGQADVANETYFDFIVVGGGTAGAALAARLAEQSCASVLLLEAGPDPPQESIVPGFSSFLKESRYDWNFTSVDDGVTSQALARGQQKQPRGRMLGGSGSLNDMVYSRGHPSDYYEWAQVAGDAWNWTQVLPYFKKTEHMTDPKIIKNIELMRYHGTNGEIEVSGTDVQGSPNAKLLQAFGEMGFPIVDDMTYPHKIGAGRFSRTIRHGRRDSSLTAMLNKVQNRNLYVLKDTLVTKILIENSTAVGVKALSNGEELFFYANKEVIVSAGTFNTPKLLMLSGIGPRAVLEKLGIGVVQDLPVGEGLDDHVMVLYHIAADQGTCPLNERDAYFDVIKYLYDGSGRLSYSDTIGVYLPQKGKDPDVPYFAIYPTCIAQGLLSYDQCMQGLGYTSETCMALSEANKQSELITLGVVLLKPQSRGRVTPASADPLHDPRIHSGTFSDIADMEQFPEAVKVALSLVNTTHFKKLRAHVVDLTPESCRGLDEEAVIRCQVRALAMAAWHSVGTARLGGVVDARLRVRGVAALRVADASVMPSVIRGNTNAAVVMIAEKAAHFIKNDDGRDN